MRKSFYLFTILLFYLASCSAGSKPEVHVVEMKQMQFQPAELSVKDGDTVVFVNHDMVAHNITEASKAVWSSSQLPPEKSWSLVVHRDWNYICTIHPTMKGKIEVK
jgi:plastocyanin